MTLNVHLLHPPKPEYLAILEPQLHPDIHLSFGDDPPPGCHILIDGRPTPEHLHACPDLRAVIVPWAGIPPETSALLADFPHISLHNSHHNDAATAETAVALLLAAAKLIVPIDSAFRRNDWSARYDMPPIVTLDGKTVLILGYGAIGQHVARACHGLGMTVLATRRTPAAPARFAIPAEIFPPSSLPDLLPHAQALIITLPLTPETEGLLGERELALMPPGGLLVNIGRGPIVDETALFQALKNGHLHAAGIDVWYNYPEDKADRDKTPPSAHPFHELNNVVMSPHRGGAHGTAETERRRYTELAVMLNAAVAGEPIPNRVHLDLGY